MHNYSLVYSESTQEDNINLSKRRIRQLSSKLFILTDHNNQINIINQQLASKRKVEMDFYKQKSRQPETKALKYAMSHQGNKEVIDQVRKISEEEKEIFVSRFQIDHYAREIPLCILIYISDTEDIQTRKPSFRSVLNQEYANYRIIAILDGVR